MSMQASRLWVWVPRWLEIGLVVLAAWLVSGWWTNSEHGALPSAQTNEQVHPVAQDVDINLLRQTPLFGQVASQQAVTQLRKEDKPVVESRLNIKLIGTVVAGEKSAAMVSVQSSRKQEVFFLHEEIQPHVTLEEVAATEIVVNNHGKRERISIEAGKPIAQAPRVTAPQKAAAVPRVAMPDTINRKINRSKLNAQMRNFSTLLSQARVSPHFTNKKPDGFVISEIVKGSLYEEIGLKNGDIIKKVNGESVTGAEQAMRMYRELQSATFIDVEIERNGRLQQISYVIR